MSRSTNEIVAEIKQLYGRRHEEKLQIQQDMAALRDEHSWTQRKIADATGISQPTVNNWLQAYDENLINLDQPARLTPRATQKASDQRVAKRVLAEASSEEIEELIDDLPKEQREQLAAAAGHPRQKARSERKKKEQGRSEADKKAREANRSLIDDFAAALTSPFISASIVLLIEQATEKLHELIEGNAMTPDAEKEIAAALIDLNREFQVASAMSGVEEEVL